jgi:hypothetical protein
VAENFEISARLRAESSLYREIERPSGNAW